jgi:hypothetical protein
MKGPEEADGPVKKPVTRKRRKFRWIKYAVVAPFIVIIFYVVYDAFWAMEFAEIHGCKLNEAGIYPCIVDGKDWGPALGTKFMIVTMVSFMPPLVILPFLLLAIFVLKDLFVYFRSKRTQRK